MSKLLSKILDESNTAAGSMDIKVKFHAIHANFVLAHYMYRYVEVLTHNDSIAILIVYCELLH